MRRAEQGKVLSLRSGQLWKVPAQGGSVIGRQLRACSGAWSARHLWA